MKNKAILGVFLLLIAVIMCSSALAVKDIDIQEQSVTINGTTGSHVAQFHVQNVGDEAVTVTATVENQPVGPGTLTITNLQVVPSAINPGLLGIGQFTVSLDNAVMGQYVGLIKVSTSDSSDSDSLVVTINVGDNGQSFTVISPPLNSTKTATTVYQTVKVQNNANHEMTVDITKAGYDGLTFNANPLGAQTVAAFGTLNIVSSVDVPATQSPGMQTATITVSGGSTPPMVANLGINVLSSYQASVSSFTISDVDPGEQRSVTFNIVNNGNMDLTGLSLSNFTITDNDGDRINVTFSPGSQISVAKGSSTTITAKIDVSDKMDPATYSPQVTLNGGSTSATFTMNIEVNSLLQVTDVNVDPDRAMPGEDFEVEVRVENLADDIDMKDVSLEVYMMDGSRVLQDDNDDDVEDDTDIGDLDAGDEQKETFKFTVPWNAEDGDQYGIKIIVKGKNRDDSSDRYEYTYTDDDVFEVNRDKDKVEIYKADLDYPTLSCTKTTYIDIGLRDIGSNDQDVILTVKNDQLGMRVQDNFEMSSDYDDDDFELEKSYLLDFSSAPNGVYPVTIIAENDDGDKLGSKSVTLTVQDCGTTSTSSGSSTSGSSGSSTSGSSTGTTSGTKENVDVVYTSGASDVIGATVPAVSAAPVVSKINKGSVFDTTLGMAMLVLGNLLLVILVVIALIYLVSGSAGKGKKKEQF